MYAVGVDSGTQGTKVVIIDFEGNILGSGFSGHQSIQGLKAGVSEQDPGVWISALFDALEQALLASKIDAGKN